MKRTYFREGNAEHGLQELGKRWELGMVLEKRGKHFVQKMVIKETRFENRESRLKQTVISGGKDSGILAEKKCFLLALSDGAEHRPYKRL